MFDSKMLSQSEHDQLTANYKLASANLAAAERKLSYAELLAPFSGTVSTVDKQRFENTTPVKRYSACTRTTRCMCEFKYQIRS